MKLKFSFLTSNSKSFLKRLEESKYKCRGRGGKKKDNNKDDGKKKK